MSDAKYTWLQWPVKIKDYDGPKKEKLHVTARFMGEELITPEQVSECIVGVGLNFSDFDPASFMWEPAKFGENFVLELIMYPSALREVHELTAGLYPSQFPKYRPHITVDEDYWNKVGKEGILAHDVLEIDSTLELWVHGEKAHTWRGKL